jgi:hypothetical protein
MRARGWDESRPKPNHTMYHFCEIQQPLTFQMRKRAGYLPHLFTTVHLLPHPLTNPQPHTHAYNTLLHQIHLNLNLKQNLIYVQYIAPMTNRILSEIRNQSGSRRSQSHSAATSARRVGSINEWKVASSEQRATSGGGPEPSLCLWRCCQ